ncbi:hypothetical protein EBR96_06010 [bacterium]|nr:hypothetical protein [bacterium]
MSAIPALSFSSVIVRSPSPTVSGVPASSAAGAPLSSDLAEFKLNPGQTRAAAESAMVGRFAEAASGLGGSITVEPLLDSAGKSEGIRVNVTVPNSTLAVPGDSPRAAAVVPPFGVAPQQQQMGAEITGPAQTAAATVFAVGSLGAGAAGFTTMGFCCKWAGASSCGKVSYEGMKAAAQADIAKGAVGKILNVLTWNDPTCCWNIAGCWKPLCAGVGGFMSGVLTVAVPTLIVAGLCYLGVKPLEPCCGGGEAVAEPEHHPAPAAHADVAPHVENGQPKDHAPETV